MKTYKKVRKSVDEKCSENGCGGNENETETFFYHFLAGKRLQLKVSYSTEWSMKKFLVFPKK